MSIFEFEDRINEVLYELNLKEYFENSEFSLKSSFSTDKYSKNKLAKTFYDRSFIYDGKFFEHIRYKFGVGENILKLIEIKEFYEIEDIIQFIINNTQELYFSYQDYLSSFIEFYNNYPSFRMPLYRYPDRMIADRFIDSISEENNKLEYYQENNLNNIIILLDKMIKARYLWLDESEKEEMKSDLSKIIRISNSAQKDLARKLRDKIYHYKGGIFDPNVPFVPHMSDSQALTIARNSVGLIFSDETDVELLADFFQLRAFVEPDEKLREFKRSPNMLSPVIIKRSCLRHFTLLLHILDEERLISIQNRWQRITDEKYFLYDSKKGVKHPKKTDYTSAFTDLNNSLIFYRENDKELLKSNQFYLNKTFLKKELFKETT